MDIKDKIQKIIDNNISEMPLYIDYQKLEDEIYQLVIEYNSYKHNEYMDDIVKQVKEKFPK